MTAHPYIFGRNHDDRKIEARRAVIVRALCLLFSSCAPPGSGLQSYAQVAAPAPGMARVWFVGTSDPQEQFGDPIIFANAQLLGRAIPGVVFYHDCPPGSLIPSQCKVTA